MQACRNYFPELVVSLYDAIRERRYEEALQLQNRALQLRDISHRLGRNIPTLHALIRMRGLETGVPRRPFFPLTVEEVNRLKADLGDLKFEMPLDLSS